MLNLRKLFNENIRPLPKDVVPCLRAAEDYVISHNQSDVQINHIVYGYLYIIKHLSFMDRGRFSRLFPILKSCSTEPDTYVKHAAFISTSGTSKNEPVISDDLTEFANVYNLLSDGYEFDFESFYLLLFYYSTNLSKSSFSYVPKGNIKSDDDSLFDFFKNNIGLRGLTDIYKFLKLEEQLLNGNIDSTLIEAPYTTNSIDVHYTTNSIDIPYTTDSIDVPYTTDLTHRICTGKLSPILIGRQNELHRLINILCKKNKNNSVLIGEPGVGKTALVYALAKKIVNNQIVVKLQGYHILEFDISSSVAGAKYRGDFEERINNVLEQIIHLTDSGKKVILYIDEIHTIVGTGATGGAMDMSEILKPFLLNSSVQIIGTSTLKDYRTIEKDKALERRFDTILVNEPSFDETVAILTGLKPSLEEFHQLTIADSTIESAVTLSKRYIPERFLPDKAIDLLDEACAIKANSGTKSKVSPDDISIAISIKKGIPIHKVQDTYDLMNLESALSSRVIGQSHVAKSLATAVRRTKAGLNDENRPLASFMFIGPTGVGKTETAKVLADLVFSGIDSIIRFDMSEYMESHSVAKLIGAPPGYVGYEEPGLLTEQVRRNPYSLVLFDEFEKAHPKIHNVLLQILDEGCLTDSKGQHINFKNTIVILTSNVGASSLAKQTIGFSDCSNSKHQSVPADVKNTFSPEFLNRLDDIIQFHSLTEKDIYAITKLHISDLIKKVNSLNIQIDISDDVITRIAQLGYSPEYGARELRRTIDKEIKNPLSDLILQNHVDYVSVRMSGGQIKILQKQKVAISV